jgi:hypothetical protein
MSDHNADKVPVLRANPATRHGGSVMARSLHDACTAVPAVLLLIVGACVIPPSLSVEPNPDAGVNSPPAILDVSVDGMSYAQPGPIALVASATNPSKMTLKLLDTDVADTLYVKIFVNYNDPKRLPARASCTAGPTGGIGERSALCLLGAMCQGDANDTTLNVVVFDRMVLEDMAPDYMALPAGGLSASRTYKYTCTGT